MLILGSRFTKRYARSLNFRPVHVVAKVAAGSARRPGFAGRFMVDDRKYGPVRAKAAENWAIGAEDPVRKDSGFGCRNTR